MKILKVFLALTILIISNACSDDDTTPVDSESLIGTWEAISMNVDSDINTTVLQIPIQTQTSSVGENIDYEVTFTETDFTVIGGYDLITTGTINGVPSDFDPVTISGINETGTYSLDGNKITIEGNLYEFEADGISLSEPSEQQVAQITLNSNGDLVMTQNIEQSVTQDGVDFEVIIDAVFVWRKK